MATQPESRPTSYAEMVWNEANMFARDVLSEKWIDKNWDALPKRVREQFLSLISEDIPKTSPGWFDPNHHGRGGL